MVSVKVSGRIEAAADAVWDLFRDFGGIQRFSTGFEKVELSGSGVGAVRTITLPGGVSLQERLEAFDDAGRRLQYAIVAGPIPVSDYLATIEVRDEGSGACRIDWSSHFEPKGIGEEQARAMIEGVYKGGIAGVKKALGV
jgi:Polyketide cyclase / dehydrase and lipid transport